MNKILKTPSRSPFALWVTLLIVVVAGLLMRFVGIQDQVLGGDEFHAPRAALQYNFFELLTYYGPAENSLPLSMYARLLMDSVGLTELNFRIPAIVSGIAILIGPLFFRSIIGMRASLIGVALLAASPMAIYFSFVARPYGPAALLLIVASLNWKKWIECKSRFAFVLWTSCAAISVFFHLLCLFPVGWLVGMSWVAARRKRIEYKQAAWMTICLILFGLALLGPGLPGLIEMRLMNSARPGTGTPLMAWRAYVQLCGHQTSTAICLLLFAVVGSVRLVQRKGFVGLTLVGLFPAILVAMLATQPYPTAVSWARYQFLVWPIHMVSVAVGIVWTLDVLGRWVAKRPVLAVVFLAFGTASVVVHWGKPAGLESQAQLWLPWVMGLILLASGLTGLFGARGSLSSSVGIPAHAQVLLLALMLPTAAKFWTPVPLHRNQRNDFLTMRRSAARSSRNVLAALARNTPEMVHSFRDAQDSGEIILAWPFSTDTTAWLSFYANQLAHQKRVVLVHHIDLQGMRNGGMRLRNMTDIGHLEAFVKQGARYLILNMHAVQLPSRKQEGKSRSRSPFRVRNPHVTLKTYGATKLRLLKLYGPPIMANKDIEIFDLWGKP